MIRLCPAITTLMTRSFGLLSILPLMESVALEGRPIAAHLVLFPDDLHIFRLTAPQEARSYDRCIYLRAAPDATVAVFSSPTPYR